MSESICRFMSKKNEDCSIKTVRFVYETEFTKLTQPFVHPIYVLHIVTKGSATIKFEDKEHKLFRGDMFFAFPAHPYYIADADDFEYIYISFMGTGALSVLSKCNVNFDNFYFSDYSFLCQIFESSIRRITPSNSNMLTEAVLYYALSFLFSDSESEQKKSSESLFETIVDYVDHHYRESDMSLGRLADTFSYTEKYLSSLFKKHMGIGFNSYLNNLRVQYANELIEKKQCSIAQIASECGYKDYSYFSKVFKKRTGKTPTQQKRAVDNGDKPYFYK